MTYQPGDRVRVSAFDMEFEGEVLLGFEDGAVVTSPDTPYYPNMGVMFYGKELQFLRHSHV